MLVALDWVLFLGHVAVIVFNMIGWIWRRTRVLHLVTIGLTAFSWFVMGAWYGWGYCFCTDYHAHVLRQLRHPDADLTFIQLLFKRLFGGDVSRPMADTLAVVVFGMIVFATITVWARELRFRSRGPRRGSAGDG
jgi:hypothetical protein